METFIVKSIESPIEKSIIIVQTIHIQGLINGFLTIHTQKRLTDSVVRISPCTFQVLRI